MELIREIFEDSGSTIGKTELIIRLKQQNALNNETRKLVDEFYNTELQASTKDRQNLKYGPLPFADKSNTWFLDIFYPFARSEDNKILVMLESKSRFLIGKKVQKVGKKDTNDTGNYGQYTMTDEEAKLLVPTIKELIIDIGNDRINKIIADAEFNTKELKKLFDDNNIRYVFINSREAHQYKGHNSLGMIDVAIKNLRLIIQRLKIAKKLTNNEVVKKLPQIIDSMNNSVNRGIELNRGKNSWGITPKRAFENDEIRRLINVLQNEEHDEVKNNWNNITSKRELDLSKPFLLKRKKYVQQKLSDEEKQRTYDIYYPKPYFLQKIGNSYITDVEQIYFMDDEYHKALEKIKRTDLKNQYVDKFGNILARFKPYEFKQYNGNYNIDELMEQDPIITQNYRGAPSKELIMTRLENAMQEKRAPGRPSKNKEVETVNKPRKKQLKTFLKENYNDIYIDFGKQRQGTDIRKWLRDNGNENIIDEYENENE